MELGEIVSSEKIDKKIQKEAENKKYDEEIFVINNSQNEK